MVATGWKTGALRVIAAVMLIAAPAGCDDAGETASEDAGDRGIVFNGIVFNGIVFNGIVFNGIVFNGLNLDGGEIDGARLMAPAYEGPYGESDPVLGLQLAHDSNRYIGWSTQSDLLEGEALIGLEQKLLLNAGSVDEEAFLLRVDDVEESESFGGVYFYELSYKPVGGDVWSSPCLDADDQPTRAVLIHGRYNEQLDRTHGYNDTHTVTLACEHSVLGKCVAAGYASWVDQDMADLHQACARMVYADYCGLGEANTAEGTAIDVQDELGLQTFETDWPVEAAWSRDGALCLNAPRKTWANPSCTLEPCTPQDLENATLISRVVPSP